MPVQTKKNDSLLTLEESHLEIVSDVLALSERIENLRRDTGVLGWKLKTLERSLIENKPFLMSSGDKKRLKTFNRHLTILEKRMRLIVNGVDRFEKAIIKRALTAGSL